MPRSIKYIEIGRVAYAVDGAAKGKLLAIVDIIDYNRVLVDGPATGVTRQEYRLNQMQMTAFKIDIHHSQCSKLVRAAWKDAKIDALWKQSQFAKNLLVAEKRRNQTDFDRFRVARLKQCRNRLVAETLVHMKEYATMRQRTRKDRVLSKKVSAYKVQEKEALRVKMLGGPEAAAACKVAHKKRREDIIKKNNEFRLSRIAKKSAPRAGTKVFRKAFTRDELMVRYKSKDGKFLTSKGGKLVPIVRPIDVHNARAAKIQKRLARFTAANAEFKKIKQENEKNKDDKNYVPQEIKKVNKHTRRHALQKKQKLAGVVLPKSKTVKKSGTKPLAEPLPKKSKDAVKPVKSMKTKTFIKGKFTKEVLGSGIAENEMQFAYLKKPAKPAQPEYSGFRVYKKLVIKKGAKKSKKPMVSRPKTRAALAKQEAAKVEA